MGDVVQFSETGHAPQNMLWVCCACGRMSFHRHGHKFPEIMKQPIAIDPGWGDRCDESAVLVLLDRVMVHSATRRCVGLRGEDGAKFSQIQEIHRRMCERDKVSMFHP